MFFQSREERFRNLQGRILKRQELSIHPKAYRYTLDPLYTTFFSSFSATFIKVFTHLGFKIPPACQIELSPVSPLEVFPTVVSVLESRLRGVQVIRAEEAMIKEMTIAFSMTIGTLKSVDFIVSP